MQFEILGRSRSEERAPEPRVFGAQRGLLTLLTSPN